MPLQPYYMRTLGNPYWMDYAGRLYEDYADATMTRERIERALARSFASNEVVLMAYHLRYPQLGVDEIS